PRGVYFAANHVPRARLGDAGVPVRDSWPRAPRAIGIPLTPPVSLVNRVSLRVFNGTYWRAPRQRGVLMESIYAFFYPLDAILDWNRIYGRRGFYQYQCVLPRTAGDEALAALLAAVRRHGTGSFLGVLKTFGDRPAPGLLSFCRSGTTVALDFANRGPATRGLLRGLDAVVGGAGGAVYPAKDACMSPALFQAAYPGLSSFAQYKDPRFSSSLWRRLMECP